MGEPHTVDMPPPSPHSQGCQGLPLLSSAHGDSGGSSPGVRGGSGDKTSGGPQVRAGEGQGHQVLTCSTTEHRTLRRKDILTPATRTEFEDTVLSEQARHRRTDTV